MTIHILIKDMLRFLFACFIAFSVIYTSAHSADESTSELRLVFTKDGKPVPGVTMYVDDDEEITTNSSGKASLEMSSGVHNITLEQDDIDLVDLNIVISYGETVTIIAEMQADADVPSIDIQSTGVMGANSTSGSGTITGQVLSGIDNEPVPGTKIILLGSAAEVTADAEGKFKIENVPGGQYGMTITQDEFKSFSLDHFVVVANEPINLDMQLFPIMRANVDTPIDDIAIEEVIVTAKYVADESSIAGALESVRLSADVTELISADQIAKSGASDAAAALNRIAGVNVGSSGFANIRGLPDRYSKTTWNGSELPSTDPVRRTIPLDLFPTDVLKGIEVQKSYSADKPGEFGGGLVDLQTISMPEEAYYKIAISTGGNTQTTFRKGLTYKGGKYDFLGKDDGTRSLPGNIDRLTANLRKSISGPGGIFNPCVPSATVTCLPTQAEVDALDNEFNNDLRVRENNIAPDVGLSIAAGNRWDRDWYTFGINTALSFDNEWQTTEGPRNNDPGFNNSGVFQGYQSLSNEVRTENEITLGGLYAMALELGESTKFESNTFLYRKTTDTTTSRNTESFAGTPSISNRNTLQWIENELFTQQFIGKHDLASYFQLPVGLDLNWRYMKARTTRDVPDRKSYQYRDRDSSEPSLGFQFEVGFDREYEYTVDKTRNFAADLDLALWEESNFPTTLHTGYSDLKQRKKNTLQNFNLSEPGGSPAVTNPNPDEAVRDPIFTFTSSNNGPAGDYNGQQRVGATYLAIEQGIFELLRFNAGVRFEKSDIIVRSQIQNEPPTDILIEDNDELPSVSGTWIINDAMQFRLAWGKTVVRPNARELSPINYEDNIFREDFQGNPNLVSSKLENRDARFEWYFGESENLSLGYFEKDIEKPIEIISIPQGEDDPYDLTFANGTQADVTGWELGLRKNLAFMDKLKFPSSIMESMFIYGNYSLIDSETTVDANFTNALNPGIGAPPRIITTALTGQPDWLANIAIGYEGDSTEATLLYNQVDDFIQAIGPFNNGVVEPDFINKSEPSLDFIFKKKIFNDFKLGFKAKNILNPKIEITQGEAPPITSYHNGREFSLSLSWEPKE